MLERVNEMLPLGNEAPTARSRPAHGVHLHSLCVRILRQHIEKLGYRRHFVIYDQGDQIAAIKKILAGSTRGATKTDPPRCCP